MPRIGQVIPRPAFDGGEVAGGALPPELPLPALPPELPPLEPELPDDPDDPELLFELAAAADAAD
ncbi:MAG: hypothetical protein HN783_13810 [Ilumatobacter sp.]|nr:hypothetical protein [Ilumatobacter sp.]